MSLLFIFVLISFAICSVNAQTRPPGTLLLNMLTKNEAVHLRRVLPKWAKIIDAWVIGIDDANTDDSREVIKEILGHIPGEMVTVHFDGMGPTWTELVNVGLKNYPHITHGIIADADFMPMQDKLDKMQLDIRCSRHMFSIWTEDHRNERKMDWIYRNIEGAKVIRRTHQSVEVPALPNQEVYQTLIDFAVEERRGGYQDRAGKKFERYIGFLEADLRDFGENDARTLYYLGHAHFDVFESNKDKPTQEHWDHLAKGVAWFKKRAALTDPTVSTEETWFANLKLGEIYERFYQDWTNAMKYYKACIASDEVRADPWFYLGQHYRLMGDHKTALPYLKKAASLDMPNRSHFQWLYMYTCLTKLELGRAIVGLAASDISQAEYREILTYFRKADCSSGDPGHAPEIVSQVTLIESRLSTKKGTNEKIAAVKKIVSFIGKRVNSLEETLSSNYFEVIYDYAASMQEFLEKFKGNVPTCREYRQSTTPYLKYMKKEGSNIEKILDDSVLWESWNKATINLRLVCH